MGALGESENCGELEDPDNLFELRSELLAGMEDYKASSAPCTVELGDLQLIELGVRNGVQAQGLGGKGLHKLIHVKADQLDSSLVEKVVVEKSGVIGLCNSVVPGTAALRVDEAFLDLDALNKAALRVVGLYGSKQVLQKVFNRLGLLDEDEASRLETGIYGVLRGELLYVFYWHPGLRMAEASRKDVSCNFIRYLVDLCDTVYVCLEVEDLKPFVVAKTGSKLAPRKLVKRTSRLEIAPARKAENNVNLLPGFHVRPPILTSLPRPRTFGGAQNLCASDLAFRISEGYARCAVLNPVLCPPRMINRTHEKTLGLPELPKIVLEWFSTCNVDLTKLPDDDFKLLCQCAELPVYEEYRSLMKSFDLKTEENKKLYYGLEEALQQDFKRMQTIFQGVLKAYRKFFYSLEEAALFSSEESRGARAHFQAKNSANQTSMEMDASNSIEVIEMERELCAMWTGLEGVQGSPHTAPSLLFPGSEFCLVDGNQKVIQLSQELGYMFVVESVKMPKSGPGPLQLQQEFVARSVLMDGSCLGHTVALSVRSTEGHSPTGPVITCRLSEVFGRLPSPGSHTPDKEFSCQVYIKLKKPSSAGMLTWMQSYDKGPKGTHARRRAGSIVTSASNIVKSASCTTPDAGDWAVKYREACKSQAANVESMIKRDLLPLMRAQRHFSIRSQGGLLKESLKNEETMFLQHLKGQISNGNAGLPTLTVTGCQLLHSRDTGNEVNNHASSRESDSADKKVIVQFVSEEAEQAHIIWKIAELVPWKNDVERAARDNTHIIIPHSSADYRLIELDYHSERLLDVVILKSGEILVFVENVKDASLRVYLSPKLGAEITSASPIKEFPRRFELIAVDETSKLVALYAQEFTKVSMYKFDESFRNMDRSNIELQLSEYDGSKDLTAMMFIPGKREMVLIDTESNVRIFQVSQGMIKPRSILLPGPPTKACVSADGSSLLVLYHRQEFGTSCHPVNAEDDVSNHPPREDLQPGFIELQVYLLDDTMAHIRTVTLEDIRFASSARIDAAIVGFQSQMHLVIFNALSPDYGIRSKILEITTSSTAPQLRVVGRGEAEQVDKPSTCPALDYIPQIFEKYATSPPLLEKSREIFFHLVLQGHDHEQVKTGCISFLESSISKIENEKGKDFSGLEIRVSADTFDDSFTSDNQLEGSIEDTNLTQFGCWIQNLVCLIPIQIARAEKNGLRPLSDGLQLSFNLNYADAVSLASVIRFGFYDAVLGQWHGPIKVISSMGKQSSGKSYLLNHLSGSLLDVAGGRCTDGVWMTLRPSATCMYVILDFEGLGSFERTEQEDMLLSILNASVSNITIFNKKDFHLDKETEAVFQRFQNGVSLVKHDTRLFRGLFYLAIKDVDSEDVEDLKYEFSQKIHQMCCKSEESFLTIMYGGQIEIAAMPPFQKSDYHTSMCEIQATIDDLEPVQQSGSNLAIDLKLVIAQISAKDWSPIDTQRAALRVDLLRKHLHSAICLGRLQGKETEALVNFDTHDAVPDLPIQLDDRTCDVRDMDLELSPYNESQVVGNILEIVRLRFELFFQRTGNDDELWHSNFERFLLALADRRRQRVLQWLDHNTSPFPKDAAVQTLRMKAVALLAELKQTLSLCSCKCQSCFLRCVLEKSHPSHHTCMGGHICFQTCTYCSEEQAGDQNECTDASGHAGPHDCKTRNHSCGKRCSLFEVASHCNQVCALKPSHAGEHLCNTAQHMCCQQCSLPSCKNACAFNYDPVGHDRHACIEKMCPMSCSMEDCHRTCGSHDHFHALKTDSHLCGFEHACNGVCEEPGACQIVTELSKRAKRFTGKRAVFEYEHTSENKGIKKKCGISIPPGRDSHDGHHLCHMDAQHYCEARCQACSYICSLPNGHFGLHDTTHGHMRDVKFVSEQEEIDLVDRRYVWGESGIAELCMMHCKSQGRGHIHLIKCQADEPGGVCAAKAYEGARHQTRKYGPDFEVAKDELTHAAYWHHLGFKDPCQEEDRREFDLCNHYCTSEEHEGHSSRSFCKEKLWHAPVPVPSPETSASSSGYVTKDGHHFGCKHFTETANHIIFVIDRSGSMATADIKPSLVEFTRRHNNRLGCVYEAIFRFIRARIAQTLFSMQEDKVSIILFSEPDSAKIVVNRREISEELVLELLSHRTTFLGTHYSEGLLLAHLVMQEALRFPPDRQKQPVIIFLSDGVNDDGSSPVSFINNMRKIDPRLVVHTILFGKKKVNDDMLKEMAAAGKGTFQASIDEVQLTKSFEGLANSLRPKVVGLMQY